MRTTASPSDAADFEAHPPALTGPTYRMLGSRAEVEDVPISETMTCALRFLTPGIDPINSTTV
jgi:hypothetical protein